MLLFGFFSRGAAASSLRRLRRSDESGASGARDFGGRTGGIGVGLVGSENLEPELKAVRV